jgi:hypothetical protein
MDQQMPGRHMIRFEALDRAELAYRALRRVFGKRVLRWDGWKKSEEITDFLQGLRELPEDAIIVGTSALDLGIDPGVRNVWAESGTREAILQSIGRLGRATSTKGGEWVFPFDTTTATIVLRHPFKSAISIIIDTNKTLDFPRSMVSKILEAAGLLPAPTETTKSPGMFLRNRDIHTRLAVVMPEGDVICAGLRIFRIAKPRSTQAPFWKNDQQHRIKTLVALGASQEEALRFIKVHGRDRILASCAVDLRNESETGHLTEGRQGKNGYGQTHFWGFKHKRKLVIILRTFLPKQAPPKRKKTKSVHP